MDFTPSLNAKGFYRFTGPPENWLTAIKYMTWGLEEKHRKSWEKIQPGDVFLIHSTGAGTSKFSNAKSGIIGLGVIGQDFTIKNNPLWAEEISEHKNKWPLLVPFSEIYLFSEIPSRDRWEAPNLSNQDSTKRFIDQLLQKAIPLSTIKGFPQMGSLSSVSHEVAYQILYDERPLYLYSTDKEPNIATSKATKLEKVNTVAETLRYTDTLKFFDSIKTRVINSASSSFTRDNELLQRAELSHSTILQVLIDLFKSRGYETRSNRFVDLYAHNAQKSFLVEVKSTENRNFRSQARKGIVQLFEYDYFDITAFKKSEELSFKEEHKILVPSQTPQDEKYVQFINYLDIGIGVVNQGELSAIGDKKALARI